MIIQRVSTHYSGETGLLRVEARIVTSDEQFPEPLVIYEGNDMTKGWKIYERLIELAELMNT